MGIRFLAETGERFPRGDSSMPIVKRSGAFPGSAFFFLLESLRTEGALPPSIFFGRERSLGGTGGNEAGKHVWRFDASRYFAPFVAWFAFPGLAPRKVDFQFFSTVDISHFALYFL